MLVSFEVLSHEVLASITIDTLFCNDYNSLFCNDYNRLADAHSYRLNAYIRENNNNNNEPFL